MHTYYMLGMITKHDDLLGTLIHDVAHLLRHEIDRRLIDHNLTRAKWLGLGVIHRKGPLTQSELASELELGEASVGRMVDRLVDRGFVGRSKDPEDRRSYKISVTPQAITLLKELDGTAEDLRKDTLHSLSEDEISTLNTGLLKLKNNLKAQLAMSVAVVGLVAQKLSGGSEIFLNLATAI